MLDSGQVVTQSMLSPGHDSDLLPGQGFCPSDIIEKVDMNIGWDLSEMCLL